MNKKINGADFRPWSPSRIGRFSCPWQGIKYYSTPQDERPTSFSQPARDGKTIHTWIEESIKQGAPLESPYGLEKSCQSFVNLLPLPVDNLYGVEVKLAIDVDGNPCKYDDPKAYIRGRIDLIQYDSSIRALTITDWKSGFMIIDPEDSLALKTYAVLLASKFKNISALKAVLVYLRYNSIKEISYTRKELTSQVIRDIYHQIEMTESLIDEGGKPIPGSHCANCPYFNACPIHGQVVDAGLLSITTEKQAKAVGEKLLILDQERSRLRGLLKSSEYLDKQGSIQIGGGVWAWHYPEKPEPEYPIDAVIKICRERDISLSGVLKSDKRGIKKLTKDDIELWKKMDDISELPQSSPTFRFKKIKTGT